MSLKLKTLFTTGLQVRPREWAKLHDEFRVNNFAEKFKRPVVAQEGALVWCDYVRRKLQAEKSRAAHLPHEGGIKAAVGVVRLSQEAA